MIRKWYDCEKNKPKKRFGKNWISENVLIYTDGYHSIGFYDYSKEQWKDITVNAYIEDMRGKWTYLDKPKKKIKLKWE